MAVPLQRIKKLLQAAATNLTSVRARLDKTRLALQKGLGANTGVTVLLSSASQNLGSQRRQLTQSLAQLDALIAQPRNAQLLTGLLNALQNASGTDMAGVYQGIEQAQIALLTVPKSGPFSQQLDAVYTQTNRNVSVPIRAAREQFHAYLSSLLTS